MKEQTALSADELKISPEVAWYLESRSIPFPDCPPKWKTPEPRKVPGALFDPERVDRVLAAFASLRHTQGQWAGQPLKPDPWQVAYILAPVFGWVRWDDEAAGFVRIINDLYADVPRKNGKSTLAGGMALYLTGGDGEEGAQVVAAATTETQAGFVFQPVKRLAESEPGLKKHFRAFQKKILHKRTGSTFTVVSNVADAQHGGNIHGAIIDELHIHKTPDLVETIESGTGSRSQSLVCIITTADSGRSETIYDRKRKRVEQLADGVLTDESVYGVIWAADPDDDPFIEPTWQKSNPGYGISPKRSYLVRKAREAEQSPADLAKFLRLHLGIRTKQLTKYIDLKVWDRNASLISEQSLKGKVCYGGLDLASTSDLCALAWDFPDGEDGHDVLYRLWMPEARLEDLNRRTAGAAQVWVTEGFLTLTPGEVVDYDFLRARINTDRESFSVKEIGYDPWNSSQLVTDLTNDGAEMVMVRQGFATMTSPTKELKRLLLEGTAEKPHYRHGGNPAIRWQIDNFAVAMDAAGNVKPDKAAAGDKIDGPVAGIMALDRALRHTKPRKSVYESRGLEMA